MRLSGDEGFGAAFPLQLQGFLVFSELAVYGRGAYRCELSRDFPGDGEGRPPGDVGHLLPHQRGENLPALEPEERPDQAEAADGLVGIGAFSLSVGGRFFSGLIFTGLLSMYVKACFTAVAFNSRTADFRWQLVSLANSSGSAFFSFFDAFLYRGRYSLVTAHFSFMVNPIRMPSSRHP